MSRGRGLFRSEVGVAIMWLRAAGGKLPAVFVLIARAEGRMVRRGAQVGLV